MSNEVYSFQEDTQSIMDEEVVTRSYEPVKKVVACTGAIVAIIMVCACFKSAKARRLAKKQMKKAKKALRRF